MTSMTPSLTRRLRSLLIALVLTTLALPTIAATIPPPGNEVPAADRAALEAGLKELASDVAALKGNPLLPDVEIYRKAVDWPLRYHEPIDVKKAKAALAAGLQRAKELKAGQSPWVTAGGPRAYISKIDGSIQPYLVIPPKNFDPKAKGPYRLDFFFHGRGEGLTELSFISGKSAGDAPSNPPDEHRFVVFPYGRYCCANKFAGEIDTLEILADMKRQYPIDDNRVLATGFSMGGAAGWHHAVHYSDLFAAASPGAGFCETRVYQGMDKSGEWDALPDYQKKLMHLYDCPDIAINLTMIPTIAYAGELDKQQQSGTLMEKALADLGYKLERVWGPKTEHKYEPNAKKDLAKRLDGYAEKGRNPVPAEIHFATYTLRYNHMFWIGVERLEKHWDKAQVDAKLSPAGDITLTTKNVSALSLRFGAGQFPGRAGSTPKATIDGIALDLPRIAEDGHLDALYERGSGGWRVDPAISGPAGLVKHHGLQGPIDDAFMESFIIVKPSGTAAHPAVQKWVEHELAYATTEWRKIFRGEPRVKFDKDLTADDIANNNLILFGDPVSNTIIAKIAGKLPIQWTRDSIAVGQKTFPADKSALIAIYPNPLNTARYVVLNSGFTFRQADHKTNSRQIAKLPDYAIIDLTTPPDDKAPGAIPLAGFFDEKWKL